MASPYLHRLYTESHEAINTNYSFFSPEELLFVSLFFFASDFFGEMYDLAEGLIRDGKAYVCELSEEEFRKDLKWIPVF